MKEEQENIQNTCYFTYIFTTDVSSWVLMEPMFHLGKMDKI